MKDPGRAVSHEDERIATCAVVAFEYIPQRAAACVGRGGEDQRTACRGQAGLNGVQDLDVRVGVGRVDIPKGQLVGDNGDVGRTAQLAERRRADF